MNTSRVLTRLVVGSLHLAALDLLPKSRCSLARRSAGRLTLTQQQQQQQQEQEQNKDQHQ